MDLTYSMWINLSGVLAMSLHQRRRMMLLDALDHNEPDVLTAIIRDLSVLPRRALRQVSRNFQALVEALTRDLVIRPPWLGSFPRTHHLRSVAGHVPRNQEQNAGYFHVFGEQNMPWSNYNWLVRRNYEEDEYGNLRRDVPWHVDPSVPM